MLIVDYLKDQGKMTDIEQSISQYFLNHEKALENITVRKMADELYVAPSTIVRFCQKLGYKGYEDFRKKYLEEADYINTHDLRKLIQIFHLKKQIVTGILQIILDISIKKLFQIL